MLPRSLFSESVTLRRPFLLTRPSRRPDPIPSPVPVPDTLATSAAGDPLLASITWWDDAESVLAISKTPSLAIAGVSRVEELGFFTAGTATGDWPSEEESVLWLESKRL